MITPKASVLDIQSTKLSSSTKESANKKVGKGFGDELVEKQRKLKKREDDDVNPSSQGPSEKQASRKDASSERAGGGASKKSAAPVASTKAEKAQPAAQAPTAATEPGKAAVAVPVEGNLVDMLNISGEGAPVSGIESVDFAKNLSSKISLEGFQMVEPQLMAPEAVAAPVDEATAALEALKSLASSVEAVQPKTGGDLKDMLSQKGEGDAMAFDMSSELVNPNQGAAKDMQASSFAAALKAQSATTTENFQQNNVDNIVSSARTILRDGGGEMQVVLTPDGLGTVDLKIGVDKGQVSVEIMTQDDQVKKLFDDSIADIRGALEQQNLKIDTLKVGVSENFDAQNQMSNGQMDMQNRDFAREFLGQFRDERQGFRTANIPNMLDGGGPLAKQQPGGLNPSSVRPMAGNGRLNVIA